MAKVKARVKVPKIAEVGELVEIKTLISHPMHSGRAVDSDGRLCRVKLLIVLLQSLMETLYLKWICALQCRQILS